MRPYTSYADRLYLKAEGPAHVVPWGEEEALCGTKADRDEWFGTGDWDETEHAAWLPLCPQCHERAHPATDADPSVTDWHQALQTTK